MGSVADPLFLYCRPVRLNPLRVRLRALLLPVCLGALCLLGMACGNSVEPFDTENGPPFALYGYLDSGLDTQTVRIEPVQPFVPFDTSRIRATLSDLTGGRSDRLRPRVQRLADGSTGLFYRTALPIVPGHFYSLQVEDRMGGRETTGAVQVPPVRPARVSGVQRDSTGQPIGVLLLLSGTPIAPTRMSLRYTVAVSGDTSAVTIAYAAGFDYVGGYAYTLRPGRDRLAVLSMLGRAPTERVALVGLEVEIRDDGPEWRDLPISNIRNGFGQFSSISYSAQPLVLTTDMLRDAGFAL